jgi:hypothetical protein
MLDITLMRAMPTKNTKRLHLFAEETLPVLNRTYPMTILNNPQRTLIVGDDNPLPGGVAKGVGKLFPEMP